MPRCLFSPVDALYCAKLVHMMHNMSVPFFSSIWYYNKVGAGGGLGGGTRCPALGTATQVLENRAWGLSTHSLTGFSSVQSTDSSVSLA